MEYEENKVSPWLIALRVIFTIALIACVIFIFHNSLENATISSARSQAVMEAINRALAKVHLGPLSHHTVRKLAHFSEYCLEGFLLMLCLRVYTRRFVRHVSWPLFGGLFTALCDETLQIVSLGRSSSVIDVWIDFAGVVAGLLVALLILLVTRAIGSIYALKKENRRLRAEQARYRRGADTGDEA
ncbi:MAG: VanZ family protein [Gemmiger sp.]